MINFFKNSLPTPLFKYFSLFLASILFSQTSLYIRIKGFLGLVDFDIPELWSFNRLSGFSEIPTYKLLSFTLFNA